MKQSKFPEAWSGERIRRILAQYGERAEEEAVAEDEAGVESSETVMSVPHELVPVIREIIAKRRRSASGGARIGSRHLRRLVAFRIPLLCKGRLRPRGGQPETRLRSGVEYHMDV